MICCEIFVSYRVTNCQLLFILHCELRTRSNDQLDLSAFEQNKMGESPLRIAIKAKRTECVWALLEAYGSDFDRRVRILPKSHV